MGHSQQVEALSRFNQKARVIVEVIVCMENEDDAAQLEELLQQRGYEPAGETLWLQLLPTPARAVAEANHLARTLRRRGYRVVTRLL